MSAHGKIEGMLPSKELGEQVAREILAEHRMEISKELMPHNVPFDVHMELFRIVTDMAPKGTSADNINKMLNELLTRLSSFVCMGA